MIPTAKQRRMVADMLGELYERIDHLPTGAIAKMAPVLAQAQREVEKDLRAWLAREGGEGRFTAQRLRSSLVQVRRTMERIRGGIEGELLSGMRIGANAAGMLATAHVSFELERFGAIFGEAIAPVAIDEAAVLAQGRRMLVNRFEASARRYTREMRARIGSELAVAKIRGETMAEAASRLQARMPKVFGGERYRAERLVRTELMNAYNLQHEQAVRQLHADDPEIRERWDAYFDRRTCAQCASLDGKVILPNGKQRFRSEWTTASGKTFKLAHERPPAHPNCRCVLTAWRAGWDSDLTHDAPELAKVPKGFERPPTDGPAAPIFKGLPSFERVDPEALYAVPLGQLVDAGLFALPGAGVAPARMESIASAWAEGKTVGPLDLAMGEDGKLFVDSGRHRLLTAMEEQRGRTLLIRLDRALEGAFEGTVPLRMPRKPPVPAIVKEARLTPRMRDYLERAERAPQAGIGNITSQRTLAERGLVTLERDTSTSDPTARVAVITGKGRAVLAALRSL